MYFSKKIIIQKKVWDEKKDYIKFVKYLFIGNTSPFLGWKGKVKFNVIGWLQS